MPDLVDPLAALAAATPPLPAAALTPVPVRARLLFRARNEDAIAALGEALGLAVPRQAGAASTGETGVLLWLGPDEWMVLSRSADPGDMVARIGGALGGRPHSLVDVTHRSVTLGVKGREAEAVLSAGCPLDLALPAFPVGTGTRTVLGKTEIILMRPAGDEFHLDVWRSFAPYLWRFLDEARREFA